MQKKINVRSLAVIGIFAALSVALRFLSLRMPFFANWLSLDIAALPALLAGFAIGPLAGLAVTVVSNLVHFFIEPALGGVGQLANILVESALVLPAALIYTRDYKLRQTKRGAMIGLLFGFFSMVAFAVFCNKYLFVPAAERIFKMNIDDIPVFFNKKSGMTNYLLLAALPFNIIKGGLLAAMTWFLYKPLSPLLHGRKRPEKPA